MQLWQSSADFRDARGYQGLRHRSAICVGGKTSPNLHCETFERLDLFLEQHLRVFYVWEHEFVEWQKLAAAGGAPPISRILRRHTKRSSRKKAAAGAKLHGAS
ncbi:unnamed protein product [Effrenium voratum]|uniref:Uncharacterized protein n=1 Tax=Effrenium voratum TaxID=2562239 RepID=A0AA36ND17_9DINO|nr:unnamed protein product [Effrenium voratum]CAJ1417183.1 unnamed protein product [Effrenium voratum]